MNPAIDLQVVDLRDRIVALNPGYVDAVDSVEPYAARINRLYFAEVHRRLFLIFADAYVFWSDDGLQSLHEVKEVNFERGRLVPRAVQSIDVAVETVDGTILLAGRDRRDGAGQARTGGAGAEVGVVWRKPRAARAFDRIDACQPAWATSKSSNASAGFLGAQHAKAVAFTVYTNEDAHFYYSLDDGLTWRRHSMVEFFLRHTHEIYLPRSVTNNRIARLWVTGGDDPSGERGGVVCIEGLADDGTLRSATMVIREMPGYRFVGIAGNGKHVFVGNESLAGGVLKIQDNRESIDAQDFEYVFGKIRHEYHQCATLEATADGVLVSGTSNYSVYAGDTVRGDSGGSVFVSTNEGASFIEIPLGAKWVTSIAYDGEGFWISTSATREYGPDVSRDRFRVLGLRKPSPYLELATPFVAKVLLLDSSRFYAAAGYPSHPQPSLGPGERTMRVDLSAYRSIALDVEALGPGRLVVEALPFYNWRLSENVWRDVLDVVCTGPERRQVVLPEDVAHNRYFRVRNAGPESIALGMLTFIGKR